jgi:cytochrome c
MKAIEAALVVVTAVSLALPLAYAGEGSPDSGKALFESPGFAGGKRSCDSCHPGGRGLSKAGGKSAFRIMGGTQNSLEEAVNFCIVNASKGKAISEDSREMKDIVSYIKSLGAEAPGY